MNHVPADDETQRDLERRALANVGGLAHRLGYLDKLNIRSEKRFVAVTAIVVVGLIAALVLMAMFQGSHEDSELARRRCSVAVWESRGEAVRDEIRRTHPDLGTRERGEMFDVRMGELSIAKCGR